MLQSVLVLFVTLIKLAVTFSDVGKWNLTFSGEYCEFGLEKSLFKDSKLSVIIHCEATVPTDINVDFLWYSDSCSPVYYHYFEKKIVECAAKRLANATDIPPYAFHITRKYTCQDKGFIDLISENNKVPDANSVAVISKKNELLEPPSPSQFAILQEGVYRLRLAIQSDLKYNATVQVSMRSPSGYLSAAIWPLYPFFGVMCGVYTVLCTLWLVVCGLQWRDLLRIQYWIGGVALLGMVESATYYAVYASINSTGYFNAEAYMLAEWVSVAKRALARMLVIIVSLGFGIVKPRLGPALQRVAGAGALWAVLAALEAWLRLHHKAHDSNRDILLAEAPLSLLDSAICWWVFVSLAYTMRTLQLRRNTIKLSLYRHFTNTLIFAVISSVIFMLYSIKSYRANSCTTAWKEVWLDEAYWHILFASVLTVIMVLWRPTNNNQRYAFTPLLDNAEDDDDEEEQFVNDAYGVKMRGTSISGPTANDKSTSNDVKDSHDATNNSLDSDLRWVEENIPTSTLPLLDSDEEIINTKFEVSKMQ